MPTDMDSSLADGPNGCTSSSSTSLPEGLLVKDVSTSTGLSARASSWTPSTILPYDLKSLASIRYFPRTSRNLRSTISSMDLPIHISGRSMTVVSPNSGGTRGPMSTFG